MTHKQATLGQSKLVATEKIQNNSKHKKQKTQTRTGKKDAKNNLKTVEIFIVKCNFQPAKTEFSELTPDNSDVVK